MTKFRKKFFLMFHENLLQLLHNAYFLYLLINSLWIDVMLMSFITQLRHNLWQDYQIYQMSWVDQPNDFRNFSRASTEMYCSFLFIPACLLQNSSLLPLCFPKGHVWCNHQPTEELWEPDSRRWKITFINWTFDIIESTALYNKQASLTEHLNTLTIFLGAETVSEMFTHPTFLYL